MASEIRFNSKNLLIKLRNGDESAFASLHTYFAPVLYNRIKKLVHSHQAAEELVQDVFLLVWKQREKIDPEVAAEAIFMRMAKSLAINHYRKAIRDKELKEQLIRHGSEYYDPFEEQLNFSTANDLLTAAIDKLPAQRKKILTLCKLEGKSYAEAARIFEVSLGTVKDHMAKAIRFLRKELKDHPLLPPFSWLFVSILFFI